MHPAMVSVLPSVKNIDSNSTLTFCCPDMLALQVTPTTLFIWYTVALLTTTATTAQRQSFGLMLATPIVFHQQSKP